MVRQMSDWRREAVVHSPAGGASGLATRLVSRHRHALVWPVASAERSHGPDDARESLGRPRHRGAGAQEAVHQAWLLAPPRLPAGRKDAVAIGFAVYHIFLIRTRERSRCFRAFLNNHWLGFAIFAGIVIEFAWRLKSWPRML